MIWVSGLNNPTVTGGFLFHGSTQDMSNFLRAHKVPAKHSQKLFHRVRSYLGHLAANTRGHRSLASGCQKISTGGEGTEVRTPRWRRTRTTRRTSLAQWHGGGFGENERRSCLRACDSCRNYFCVAHHESCCLTSCHSVGS